jgi:putative ABC transport system permease protein
MISDLKYALRTLAKSPAFTLVAILTLALGIGANSAIFSVIDAVLLRPLPFKDPDQIVMVWARYANDTTPVRGNGLSFPDYADLRDQSKSFSAMAAYWRTGGTLSLGENIRPLKGVEITPEVFAVLGVPPMLGRGFTEEDARNEADHVVILTYPFWKSVVAGDPNIIGRKVSISAVPHTVIAVMPPGWKFPIQDEHVDYVVPLPYGAPIRNNRAAHFFGVVGRLKPGVSVQNAEVELSSIARRRSKQYPDTNLNFTSVAVVPLHPDVVGEVRPALIVLFGAVVLVLLIACANVANLLLARAASRSREIAIRTALGASRLRVVRQLLCESVLLALLGGTAGLLLAWWGVDLLGAAGPQGLPHIADIKVNLPVCAFTFALAIGSTLVFGLIPALQVSRPNINESLQGGAKGSTGGLYANRVRAFLVISQISISLLLLAGAGLLIRSFWNLRAENPGFDPNRIHTLRITLPGARYPETQQPIQFWDRLLPVLAALPGVESASAANGMPFSGYLWIRNFIILAQPTAVGNEPSAERMDVDGNYFATMNIPLRAGRMFSQRDNANAPPVMLINESFARKFFPGMNPIGQQLVVGPEVPRPPREIVGVVSDTRHNALGLSPVPEMYLPLPQTEYSPRQLDIIIRTSAPSLSGLNTMVRDAVHAIDRDLYVADVKPMAQMLGASLAQPRFNMMLLAVFAGVAVVLAAIGIYGVIAYSVTQRTREIGIRMALGAQRPQMFGMVLRQSMTLVIIGIAIGFLVALAATRLMATLLYGVSANDISIYAVVIVLLGAAAFFASYIPARRAMKVDPMVALRYE